MVILRGNTPYSLYIIVYFVYFFRDVIKSTCEVCSRFEGDFCNLTAKVKQQMETEGLDVKGRKLEQGC